MPRITKQRRANITASAMAVLPRWGHRRERDEIRRQLLGRTRGD